jgi:hypothetical protein
LFDFCLVASPSKEGVRPAHPSGLLFSFQGSVASGDFLMLAPFLSSVKSFLRNALTFL